MLTFFIFAQFLQTKCFYTIREDYNLIWGKGKMAFKAMASDPILQRQMQAYYTSTQLSRGAMESVEDYNKRIEQYKAELQEKLKAENTELLKNKIAGISPSINSDMDDLKNANSQINSLKFWQFALDRYDTSLDGEIARLKKQQNLIQQKIEELKKGKQDGSRLNLREQNAFDFPSAETKAQGMFDNDVMATGKRNILS